MDAAGVAADAQLRLLGHLDLGDQRARCRIPPGELDAGCLTDQTASSVAPDEVVRPQRLAVGQLDVDAGVVLRETGHLTSAIDRHRQLADPAGQDALDVVLPQPEPVGMPGGKVADVQTDRGEARHLSHLSLREEPIGDSTLIEDLDGARVQTACARAGEVLAGAPLDDGNVDPRQRQLARQHQPRGTSSGDHHRMLGHRHTPLASRRSRAVTRPPTASSRLPFRRSGLGRRLRGTTRVLPQAPRCAIRWQWRGVGTLLAFLLRLDGREQPSVTRSIDVSRSPSASAPSPSLRGSCQDSLITPRPNNGRASRPSCANHSNDPTVRSPR